MKKVVISEKIKDYRRERKLMQMEFGRLISVSYQTVSKWEICESYPDIMIFSELAELLLCSVNDFFV